MTRLFSTRRGLGWATLAAGLAAACAPQAAEPDLSDPGYSFYALVQTIDGTSFGPPLGPTIAPSGTFDASLLARLAVILESEDGAGHVASLGRWDASTAPALKLLAAHELYWMNVPAAAYFTDPSLAYRFRVLLDGREVARSDMSSQIFQVLRYVPSLPVGVKLRLEARGAPTLVRLAPDTLVAGADDFTLTVTGSGFVHDSVVQLAGRDLATTWISATSLTAAVPATAFAEPGALDVRVVTPAPGGGASAALPFVAANPTPTLTAISPSHVLLGDAALTMTLTGASFVPGAIAALAGVPLATTFVAADRLEAAVPAAILSTSGLKAVTVQSPAPGGTSAALELAVQSAAPAISAVAPASVPVGSGAVTLTIDGDGFLPGAQVSLGTTPLATTYTSAARLLAVAPASAFTAPTTFAVTVSNPAPTVGPSLPASLTCLALSYAWTTGDFGACTGGTSSYGYGAWGTCTGGAGAWSYGSWGTCSASAVCSGAGTQSRTATCNATTGSGTQTRSASCGWNALSGSMARAVTCVDNFGRTVADAFCAGARPATTQACTPTGEPACGSAVTAQSCTPASDPSLCGTAQTSQACSSPAGNRSCAVTNGTGIQTCAAASTSWGSCTIASCNTGYVVSSGQCIPATLIDQVITGPGWSVNNGTTLSRSDASGTGSFWGSNALRRVLADGESYYMETYYVSGSGQNGICIGRMTSSGGWSCPLGPSYAIVGTYVGTLIYRQGNSIRYAWMRSGMTTPNTGSLTGNANTDAWSPGLTVRGPATMQLLFRPSDWVLSGYFSQAPLNQWPGTY